MSWYTTTRSLNAVEIALACALEQDQVSALDGVVGDRRRAKVLHGRGCPPDGDLETAGV